MSNGHKILVKKRNNRLEELDVNKINICAERACKNLDNVSANEIVTGAEVGLYNKIPTKEIDEALILSARSLIEKEPNYEYVAARLLLSNIHKEVFGEGPDSDAFEMQYRKSFITNLKKLAKENRIDERLLDFDLKELSNYIVPDRDKIWKFIGIKTLYDRYLIHLDGKRMESPQSFWMRVAMGLSINEKDKNASAKEFYDVLSQNLFVSATPTLFNSGTPYTQLSSCYLSTVEDSIDGIFGSGIHAQARLSKFAGGLGVDWTPIRSHGSYIKGTNGNSLGLIPFLKVFNNVLVSVNQCFAPNTKVCTSEGYKRIKDLQKEDLVLGQNGEFYPISEVFVYEQKESCVEIDTKHSVEPIQMTSGHPILSCVGIPKGISISKINKDDIHLEWKSPKELQEGDFVAIAIPKETIFDHGLSLQDAYVYGRMLGDGHITKNGYEAGLSFHKQDKDGINYIVNYLEDNNIHYWQTERDNLIQVRWSASSFIFDSNDFYNHSGLKRILPKYLNLPHGFCLQIIKGLIDSDGNISRGKEITFSNTSEELIDGLRHLLLRLGIPSSGNKRKRVYDHNIIRSCGHTDVMCGKSICYDLRIPAEKQIADLFGIPQLTKFNWIKLDNYILTRIKSIKSIKTLPVVFDLKVQDIETYNTNNFTVHNGGKRKGAGCAYLETWHGDIWEFLELRDSSGDPRVRCHDTHTANWIPDLFMRRVQEDGDWYLFSPGDCPDLHELYGEAFDKRYQEYCDLADNGEIDHQKIKALDLWRRMIEVLFETSHPWMTWKDPSNIRYTNSHVGIVHSSNLCTEILEHTTPTKFSQKGEVLELGETAVCNLGSLNIPNHIDNGNIKWSLLKKTIKTAVRMLDNVIDLNFYPVPEAEKSNMKNRHIGLGIMGFFDSLYMLDIPLESKESVDHADYLHEFISYNAILSSSRLAKERGVYPNYEGSAWSQDRFPIDTYRELMKYRGRDVRPRTKLSWDKVRESVKQYGMRNANLMAIAPTATISFISGCSQSIEPEFSVLFSRSALSGEFTRINRFFVDDMKERGLWGPKLINALKSVNSDLSLLNLDEDIKNKYKTAHNLDQKWLIDMAAARQKWIDMGQSFNLYNNRTSKKYLSDLYFYAWMEGLKTTYYLHNEAASTVEKSTGEEGDNSDFGTPATISCPIDAGPDCESCQ